MPESRIRDRHDGHGAGSGLHERNTSADGERARGGRNPKPTGRLAATDGGICVEFRSGRKRSHGFVAPICYFPNIREKRISAVWRGKGRGPEMGGNKPG